MKVPKETFAVRINQDLFLFFVTATSLPGSSVWATLFVDGEWLIKKDPPFGNLTNVPQEPLKRFNKQIGFKGIKTERAAQLYPSGVWVTMVGINQKIESLHRAF